MPIKLYAPGTAKPLTVSGVAGTVAFDSEGIIPDDLVITSVGFNGRASVQLMQSLGKSVYVYNFGLRDTMLIISGVAFRRCDQLGDPSVLAGSDLGPAQDLYPLIQNFAISADEGRVITVTVGTVPFTGMLESLTTTFTDPSTRSMGFELRMHVLNRGAIMGSPGRTYDPSILA